MDKNRMISDVVSGSILGIFSILMIWYIIPSQIDTSLSSASSASIGVTSRTFPTFASAMIGLASLGLVISSIVRYFIWNKKKTIESGNEATGIKWKEELKGLSVYAMCVLYGVIYINAGYIIASLIVLPITLFILGSRNIKHYIIVYVLMASMYCIFRYGLNVLVP